MAIDFSPRPREMASLARVLVAVVFVLTVTGRVQAENQPNFIYIMADDLGYNDIGYNNPAVQTPALDDLATNGRILTQSYMQPICTPSRAAVLTGRYPFSIGVLTVYPCGTTHCLPTELPLLSDELKALGYETHAVGKWHLGMCQNACLPTNRGFDTFYGTYNNEDDHQDHTAGKSVGLSGYDWWNGTHLDHTVVNKHSTDLMADRVVDIIENKKEGKPFFVYMAASEPHFPWQEPSKYRNLYSSFSNKRKRYLASITHLDDSIKSIVDALKSEGTYDNTIIIFASDHGGKKGGVYADNSPYLGGKGTLLEGGCRVITFVHGPLLTNVPSVHEGLIHGVDWFPTILSIAGGSAGSSDPTKGLDQRDMVLNGGASLRNDVIYDIQLSANQEMITETAIRDERYKLMWTDASIADHKNGVSTGNMQLYDLNVAFPEVANLAGDVNLQPVIQSMTSRLMDMIVHYRAEIDRPTYQTSEMIQDGDWLLGWCADQTFCLNSSCLISPP